MSLPVVKPECMIVEEDSKPNHHLYPLAGPASAFFFSFSFFHASCWKENISKQNFIVVDHLHCWNVSPDTFMEHIFPILNECCQIIIRTGFKQCKTFPVKNISSFLKKVWTSDHCKPLQHVGHCKLYIIHSILYRYRM